MPVALKVLAPQYPLKVEFSSIWIPFSTKFNNKKNCKKQNRSGEEIITRVVWKKVNVKAKLHHIHQNQSSCGYNVALARLLKRMLEKSIWMEASPRS